MTVFVVTLNAALVGVTFHVGGDAEDEDEDEDQDEPKDDDADDSGEKGLEKDAADRDGSGEKHEEELETEDRTHAREVE